MQTATVSAWTPCSSRSLSPCASPAASLRGSWSYDILFLPSHLERHIKILKSSLPLGVTLDADVDKAINGCVVKNICSKKALAKDGRIQTGDFIVKINGENLRNVTNAQARAIMKRANLIGAHCNISYITSSDARLWKDRFHRLDSVTMFPTNDNIQQIRSEQNVFESSRLSPKVYPKFYKSPLFNEDLLLLATTTNALNFSIGSSELQSPNNVDEHFLPSTSEILENKEESRKEEISQLNQINFEKFVDNLQKAIITDAIFDLYILWRRDKQSILHSNIAPSLSSQFSTSPKTLRSPRAVRASSIALTQPPPKPEKGILRRAASSFKKKRSKPIEEQNTGYVTSATTTPNIGMNSRSRQNSDTLEISEMNVTTTSSLPTSPKCDEFRESTNREPMNFWSEPRSVILQRNPNETFGISIVGGRVEVSQKGIEMATFGGSPSLSSTVSGIFIKSVVADSPAGRCGKLFMGDRLLKVNDIDLLNTTHENAVQAIKNAENPVCFVVQSLQSLQTFVAREGNSKKDSLTSIISEGQTSIPPSPAIVEIDTESAAALEKDEEDNEIEDTFHYTKRKVLMKYSDLPGKPVLIRMPNIPPGGLGLILSTRRDEGASRPPVIVVGVKSDSPLSLKVGDELLEINGRVLFGLSHQNATEKIRKCCQHSSLSLLVLRNVQESQSSSTQQSEQEEIKNTTENIINKNNNDLKTNDEIEVLTEKENTSESECEAGARTIVSEILSRQQKTPEVKIEPPEDAPSAIDGLKPETTQNDSVNSTNEPISRKRSWQMEQQQSQFLQKCPIQIGQETLIEIDKDGKGLGLSIVGGSDTVLGTVIIHEVYPDGAAAIDGRLKPGDQVFEVNNTSLRNSTHEQAILLLRRTPTKVRLLVYRDQNLQMSLLDPTQIYNIIDIELLKKAGKGLGISIVGRKNEPGVYVSEIVKGGVADTDGRLMQGDQILSVNNHDVANWMQEDVATVLKTCIGKVSLKIGRWKLTETAQRVRSAQPPPNNSDNSHNTENNINSIEETQMPLQQQQNINEIQSNLFSQEKQPNGTKDPPPPAPFPPGGNKLPPPTLQITLHDENNQQANLMGRTDLSPVSEEDLKSIAETVASEETISGITTTSSSQRRPISQLQNSQSAASTSSFIQPSAAFRSDLKEAGCDSLLITLKKDEGQQWGMGIGKRPRGILITSLQPGSSAAEKLAIGDRIMAVNAHEVTTQHSAVTYIRSSGNSVTLQISRPAKLSTTTTTSNN